jgi:hypothetical protein
MGKRVGFVHNVLMLASVNIIIVVFVVVVVVFQGLEVLKNLQMRSIILYILHWILSGE